MKLKNFAKEVRITLKSTKVFRIEITPKLKYQHQYLNKTILLSYINFDNVWNSTIDFAKKWD